MSAETAPEKIRFIPLECNPDVFTELAHKLGLSPSLSLVDVYSLDDPDLLAFVPRPVYALILAFPVSDAYRAATIDKDVDVPEYQGFGPDEDVIWFKQTIGNACGLYGLLHSVTNGKARNHIEPNTTLARLLKDVVPLNPQKRIEYLESAPSVAAAHSEAGNKGDTAVLSPTAWVEHHYVAFAPSHKTGHVFQLDGMRKRPIDLGPLLKEGDDMLSPAALNLIREFIDREKGMNLGFSLLALVQNGD